MNGALLHIKMQNFKSHGNFEMSFGPRLNFVVGRNGTGKSSILAAVIAALGGNPNKHSNNAGGQKAGSGLVRDGSSWASVQLEIANGGPDPFYLDDDGSPPAPKLVISLRLNKNEATGRTTSAYSINGHATPLKKVRELAEFYNYEVENPCVVNTQAVSASFLRDPKDAAKRYQFFLRAANLEPLKNDYKAAYKEKATVEERLARHGEQREFLAEQLVLAQRRANAASERLELERGIEQAARRSAYAILNSAKSGLALTREGFTSLKDKAEALGKEEAAAKEALRHARNDAEKLIQSRKDLTVKLSEHSRKASDLKKEWKVATRKVKDEEGRMNDAIDEQKEQRKAISELERSINEQRKGGLDAATRKAEAALNAKIDKLNAGNEAVKREKAEMERSLTPLEEAVQSAQQASALSRRASADAKKDQSGAHAEAARLTKAASANNAQDGKAALFHRDMPALLHAISNAPAGTWKAYQPVGPLGMHLSARPEFVRAFGAGSDAAIEKACGGWPNLVVTLLSDATRMRASCASYSLRDYAASRLMCSHGATRRAASRRPHRLAPGRLTNAVRPARRSSRRSSRLRIASPSTPSSTRASQRVAYSSNRLTMSPVLSSLTIRRGRATTRAHSPGRHLPLPPRQDDSV